MASFLVSTPCTNQDGLSGTKRGGNRSKRSSMSPVDDLYDEHRQTRGMKSKVITPDGLIRRAEEFGVDLSMEPYLIWIFKEAMQTPLPPSWREIPGEDGGPPQYRNDVEGIVLTDSHPADDYIQQQINKERLGFQQDDTNMQGAWLEFYSPDSDASYFYNFVTGEQSSVSPGTLELAPTPKPVTVTAQNSMGSTISHSKPSARTSGAGGGVLRPQEVEILTFKSWWNETGAFGMKKKHLTLHFSLVEGSFQVVISGSDKVYTISHIQGAAGPLECWDLHVGATLNVLGRTTTLMQADLLTLEWLDWNEKKLRKYLKKTEAELRKYDPSFVHDPRFAGAFAGVGKAETRPGKPVTRTKRGCSSLRALMNLQIEFCVVLADYRPSLAQKLLAESGLARKQGGGGGGQPTTPEDWFRGHSRGGGGGDDPGGEGGGRDGYVCCSWWGG